MTEIYIGDPNTVENLPNLLGAVDKNQDWLSAGLTSGGLAVDDTGGTATSSDLAAALDAAAYERAQILAQRDLLLALRDDNPTNP